jgi:uncharacterized HAD superfamily protein
MDQRYNYDESSNFKDFLLKEYSNIAQAHFASIEAISKFFRYYLIIMSIPLSTIAIISKIGPNKGDILNISDQYKLPTAILLFCISLIGLGVFGYIINLRLDVVLYARVVNGIRKYFYDKYHEDINLKLRYRVLPQSPQLPPYFEKSYFFPVVGVFSVMNSFYFILGSWYLFTLIKFIEWVVVATLLFLFLHFLIYGWFAQHRKFAYLRSNIIGIDIDGVLNRHREHFCKILEENTNKKIKPEEILIIPVHELTTLDVTRGDERKVFNDPRYWVDMPVINEIPKIIKKLRNIFNLKIYIFTYRPWPDSPDDKELIKKIKSFLQNTEYFSAKLLILKLGIKLRCLSIAKYLKEEPLIQITKKWLKDKGVDYDKFIFEKGNDYSSNPNNKFKNRFYISRKKKIRFFVEDDFEKAIKLSYICDIVFLISHPYNEPNDKLSGNINNLRKNLPSNIIRVKDWNEIYQYIRRLS